MINLDLIKAIIDKRDMKNKVFRFDVVEICATIESTRDCSVTHIIVKKSSSCAVNRTLEKGYQEA